MQVGGHKHKHFLSQIPTFQVNQLMLQDEQKLIIRDIV
ncbi:MAG: hypothetical protein BSOLF_1909 [Candidatus Carbobacillus altaicus]|uniref:Uncharacterized protein n=1 Tax=Candidatus Carbonibacillus altaicus TaxID=2163959 RepID=A0A2R6XYR8_9BACL|nr:MAG: hypothetical protein BSOLF_1909 [Candidatus Carbobacillus altaicus]